MTAFLAIFKRELKSYFSTPVGYVFIVVFLVGNGYLTFAPGYGNFYESRYAHLSPMFNYIPYLYIFLVPAIAMRLWAEERRSGTAELLFTLPVKVRHAVIAKFLAAWAVLALALGLTTTLIFITYQLGSPDPGPIITGYLACLLLGGVYLAIGCFCSALCKNQVIAFILSVIACILFLLLGSPPFLKLLGEVLPQFGVDFLNAHSMQSHFDSMLRGVLEVKDLAFFFFTTVAWLIACGIILDHQKAD